MGGAYYSPICINTTPSINHSHISTRFSKMNQASPINRNDITQRELFNVFIKPECICLSKNTNCSNISYIGVSDNNISLNHETRYGIGLVNGSDLDCLYYIFIDGDNIGKFYVDRYSTFFFRDLQMKIKDLYLCQNLQS